MRTVPPGGAAHGAWLRLCLAENYARLQRHLHVRLGCADLASECLHDAWLRLGEAAPAGPVRDPEAYIYRMAYHLAIDRLRSDRAGPHAGGVQDELDLLQDAAPGPQAIAEARSELRAVDRAMRSLPYRHGCVLVALRVEERTRQEVAQWLAVSPRSVDTMLRQTLARCASPGRAVQGL